MKEFKISCNGQLWEVTASNISTAIFRVVKSEQRRLKARSKEIGKRLKLSHLEISWKKQNENT